MEVHVMAAALLRALLVAGSLVLAVFGPASGQPYSASDHAVITAPFAAPCPHAADHVPAAACARGMTACWSHCPQAPQTTAMTEAVLLPQIRSWSVRDIVGSDQQGPTRHLPPPKLLS